MTTDQPLAGIVRRRSELGKAMQKVELAAAAAAGKDSWKKDLEYALGKLESAWQDHVEEAEAPGGLHERILNQAPRLQRKVASIQEDHRAIATSIAAALEGMRDATADTDKEELRNTALDVLLALARHRQHGADLIFDAYSIDIGGY
jgi:hypothetical protein